MSETNEAEALDAAYHKGWHSIRGSAADDERHAAGLEAVAAHVRTGAERQRDEARAELAKARERVEHLENIVEGQRCDANEEIEELRVARDAAESALAALRHAVRELDAYLDFGTPWEEGELGIEDPTGINAAQVRLRDLLDTTPASECPDTATLRAIRERAEALRDDHFPSLPEAVRDYVSDSCWRVGQWVLNGATLAECGQARGGAWSAERVQAAMAHPNAGDSPTEGTRGAEDWRTVERAVRNLYSMGHSREAANGTALQDRAMAALDRLRSRNLP